MAVAPALPVEDLHDLLIEFEHDVPAARSRAMRASRGPSAKPAIKSEWEESHEPSRNARLMGYGYDGDEVMIKIDPNESFLEYVSEHDHVSSQLHKRALI